MKIESFLFVVAVAACTNIQSKNNSAKDLSASTTDSSSSSKESYKRDFTKDTIIIVRFPKDSSSVVVTGEINGINKPVTAIIPVTKGGQLVALLVPEDSVANIRINQFFSPDGKADGPFGRTLTRKISQQGNYKLIIGEDLMQGEEWKGKFDLKVTVN